MDAIEVFTTGEAEAYFKRRNLWSDLDNYAGLIVEAISTLIS